MVLAVSQGAIVLVDIRDKGIDQTITETAAGRHIPVAVIRKNQDQGHSSARVDQDSVCCFRCFKLDRFVVHIGLPMEHKKDRIFLPCAGHNRVGDRSKIAEEAWSYFNRAMVEAARVGEHKAQKGVAVGINVGVGVAEGKGVEVELRSRGCWEEADSRACGRPT